MEYRLLNLLAAYRQAHNAMRNIDGLQPQESFDELLKFLLFKQFSEQAGQIPKSADAIRRAFETHLDDLSSWANSLWRDRSFHLSDRCLEKVSSILSNITFSEIDYDVRSAALREFLTPEIRKGLGIFLTPDQVVREVIRFVAPSVNARCLDPACGSGTFLIELVKFWRSTSKENLSVWGIDKNPRMLLIGELNLGHFPDVEFNRALSDALVESDARSTPTWNTSGYFDFIFTNPPFGVTIATDSENFDIYKTTYDADGKKKLRQSSEWLFVEKSLHLLKPGGTLAIVLPKSALTNPSSARERAVIAELGRLRAAIVLPPETFLVTGAQTNAVVAIISKYNQDCKPDKKANVIVANISNVGYDSTDRPRKGNQLIDLAKCMRSPKPERFDHISVVSSQNALASFEILSASGVRRRRTDAGVPLGDIVSEIKTGRTPPRAAYSENDGLFLIKVGNLTGSGIRWIARDRNFIDTRGMSERRFKGIEMVRLGDIVLTSSAHSPVYIAKKVDIVSRIPSWVGGRASFVGEVMLVRPKSKIISSTLLLAYLRHPEVVAQIQQMVRGQTAHLHPDDLSELRVPVDLLTSSETWKNCEALLLEEIRNDEEANILAYKQLMLFSQLSIER